MSSFTDIAVLSEAAVVRVSAPFDDSIIAQGTESCKKVVFSQDRGG